MKNIQSLTLMMAVMVYAAPSPAPTTTPNKKIQLGAIIKTVNILLCNKTLKELDFKMPRLTQSNGTKCPSEFFCLAEEALILILKQNKTANLSSNVTNNVNKLRRELHQYKMQKNVSCSLNTSFGLRPMRCFLEDVKECTNQEIKNITHG